MTKHAEPNGGEADLAGRTRRTTIDEPRLSELVELYEELGDGCQECYMADPERHRTIYTRVP